MFKAKLTSLQDAIHITYHVIISCFQVPIWEHLSTTKCKNACHKIKVNAKVAPFESRYTSQYRLKCSQQGWKPKKKQTVVDFLGALCKQFDIAAFNRLITLTRTTTCKRFKLPCNGPLLSRGFRCFNTRLQRLSCITFMLQ